MTNLKKKNIQGCQPYQVSPCPYDKNGNKTCKDKPVEVNHECKTRCFGDEEIEYYDDHKFSKARTKILINYLSILLPYEIFFLLKYKLFQNS